MGDGDYERCKFSVTCHTNDLAVVHCLRALCEYAIEGVRRKLVGVILRRVNGHWLAIKSLCVLRRSNLDSVSSPRRRGFCQVGVA